MIDSSIMGIGKGAGNLNTELLLEHLNTYYGKKYDISPLLEVMDKVLNQIHAEYYWGYSPEFYLSSANHCSPSYASHFYNKHMLPIDQVAELLALITDEKKISFDKDYAETLYVEYNSKRVVDEKEVVKQLVTEISERDVLLIAPGKSIIESRDQILELQREKGIVSISLNLLNEFEVRYIITTRKDIYTQAVNDKENVIVTSNISKGGRGNVKVLNYENWIELENGTHDSSSIIAFRLMELAKVNKVYLAGFDGFSADINDNYYNEEMRVPVSVEQASNRNRYFANRIKRMQETGIKIEFVTKSKYEL